MGSTPYKGSSMASTLSSILHHHCIFGNRKNADSMLESARRLMGTQERVDVSSALGFVDSALELCPRLEAALELKARALLYLRRYKDVVTMLSDYLPSKQQNRSAEPNLPSLSCHNGRPILRCFSAAQRKLNKKLEKEQWRLLVLGQACCHLGMMEDAMILLQSCRKLALTDSRKQSNGMHEDEFMLSTDNNHPCCSSAKTDPELQLVNTLLTTVKTLNRRQAAGMAALTAGLYTEAIRLFSKILDYGKRSNPQGFVAKCYTYRAMAYQGAGRVADAIADCNRALVLHPGHVEALRVRAALFESAGCFPECLQDLEHLKMGQEALLRRSQMIFPHPDHSITLIRQDNSLADLQLQLTLDSVNTKIREAREKLIQQCPIDFRMLLGLPQGNCCRADVERAFLLISLKHRPDKASLFVERCEFIDKDRDIDGVREEARSSSARLFRLIQRAHIELLSSVEEMACKSQQQLKALDENLRWRVDKKPQTERPPMKVQEEEGPILDRETVTTSSNTTISSSSEKPKFADVPVLNHGLSSKRASSSSSSSSWEESGIMPAAVNRCREVVNVEALISQTLSAVAESWMMNHHTDWTYQTLPTLQPLPVT